MDSPLQLYDPFNGMQFNSRTCFLCGTGITSADTVWVFPEWLMQAYNFADNSLLLLDKSVTTYRELTIPCCPVCRQTYLEPLEQKMQKAHSQGITGFGNTAGRDIFLWMTKIFYGILVRELLNEQNPLIKPEHSVGENPKMFTKFQSLFKLLQTLRVPVVFDDFTPFSLFMLESDPTEDETPFAYRDELSTMVFSIKMGSVTLIGILLDNGILQKVLGQLYGAIQAKTLHPVQVAEFTARAYYGAYLLNIIPEYFERKSSAAADFLIYDTLVDDITMPVFNPWDNQAYAKVLADMWQKWGISQEQIVKNPQEPLSFLLDEQGAVRQIVSFPAVGK